MKVVTFLLAIGVAAASLLHTPYQPGTEYLYRYETQVITGVPHHGKELAGLTIKTNVRLQFKTEEKAVMQLTDVEIFKIETEVPKPWPDHGLLPESKLTPVESYISSEMTEELTKPVKFTYESGSVENIKMDPSEKLFSVNIKKAILSTLKVKLVSKDSLDERISEHWQQSESDSRSSSEEKELRFEHRLSKSRFENEFIDDKTENRMTKEVYRVMESDISGVCESVYSIQRLSGDELRMTRDKNYNNCEKELIYEQGLISGLTIVPHELNSKEIIEKVSDAEYEIKGNPKSFIIRKLKQVSKYLLTPLKHEDGSIVTSIIQLLTLIDAKPIREPISPSMSLQYRQKGLEYEFASSPFGKPMTPEYEDEEEYKSDTPEKMRMIDELLEEIIPLVHPVVTELCVEKIHKIATILKHLSTEEMINLCEKYIKSPELYSRTVSKKREILLDILPSLTTPQVIPVIGHLITHELISTTRAVISLKLMSLFVTPDQSTSVYLAANNKEFMDHPVIQGNRILKNTVIITVGTLIRRLINHADNFGVPLSIFQEKMNSRVKEVYGKFEKESNLSSKIAGMKAIGNIGMPVFLPMIKTVLLNKNEPLYVRKSAIFAFRRMPHEVKPLIQDMLAAVYMDLTEDPQIRMAAFVSLMDTKPSSTMLNFITRVQRKETSVQVGSIVYSYLSTLAKADLPGFRKLAEDIRMIMPLVRAVTPNSISSAKGIYMDYMSKLTDLGIGVTLFKNNVPESMLPTELISRINLHVMGQTIDAFRGGFYCNGLNPILNKLVGVHRNFMDSYSEKPMRDFIADLLIPLQSGSVDLGSIAEEIKEIIEKLEIVDRPTFKKLNIGMFIGLLGNDITWIDLSADDIMGWIETGRMPIIGDVKEFMNEFITSGKTFDVVKVLNLGKSSMQIPTSAGLPIFVNVTGTAVAHVMGELETSAPKILDMIHYGLSGKMPSEIDVHSNIKPSMVAEVTAMMGVNAGLLHTGVSIKAIAKSVLPIKVHINAKLETGKLTHLIELPDEGAEALKIEFIPEIFVTSVNPRKNILSSHKTSSRLISDPINREVLDLEIPVPVSVINTHVNVRVHTTKSLRSFMPYSYLWGRKSLRVELRPIEPSRPIEIVLEATSTFSGYRAVSRDSLIPDRINIHPLLSEPKVIKFGASIGTRGSYDKPTAALTLLMSNDLWVHQLNSYIHVPKLMNEPLTGDIVINLNAFVVHRHNLESLPRSVPAIDVKFSGPRDVSFEVKVLPEPSEDVTFDKWTKNVYFRTLEVLTGKPVAMTMIESTPDTPDTVTYKVTINTRNIDLKTLETVTAGLSTLGFAQFGDTIIPVIDAKTAEKPRSDIEALVTYMPKLSKLLIAVRTQSGMQYSAELPTYMWTPWYKMITVEKPLLNEMPEDYPRFFEHRYPSEAFYGTCSVHNSKHVRRVTSFDSVNYNIPTMEESCEMVLAKDCSELSLFTVIATPSQESKMIKMLIPNHEIKLKTRDSWLSSELEVMVDEEELQLHEDTAKLLTDESRIYGEVYKRGNWVTVKATQVGLVVSTDGKEIMLKANPLMRDRVCGLCGNFNGERRDDWEGPDRHLYPNPEIMISKYVLPSDKCSKQSVREWFKIKDDEECTITERTAVIERNGETCFSMNPVPTCPSSCTPKNEQSRRVGLHCRSSNSMKTREMIEESRVQKVVRGLSWESVDDTRSLEIPTRCLY